jgi:hypothetical protein
MVEVAFLAATAAGMPPPAVERTSTCHSTSSAASRWKAIIATICRAMLDDEIAALDEACIPEPVHKCFRLKCSDPRPHPQPADYRQLRLRARRTVPRPQVQQCIADD